MPARTRCPSASGACDLDRILDGFRPGAEEDRLLLSGAGSHRAQALGQPEVRLVHHDLEGGVSGAVQLLAHRGHDARVVVAHVHDSDPAHEVDVAAAGGVPELRSQGVIGHQRMGGRDAARHVSLA